MMSNEMGFMPGLQRASRQRAEELCQHFHDLRARRTTENQAMLLDFRQAREARAHALREQASRQRNARRAERAEFLRWMWGHGAAPRPTPAQPSTTMKPETRTKTAKQSDQA